MAVNRLLVTGATGFVGKWTLRHWRAVHPDVEIWATSDQPDCPEGLVDEFAVLDLRDGNAASDFVNRCNPAYVVHLASLVSQASLAEHLAVNVVGTENIYSALARMSNSREIRVVQAGTAAMYGYVRPDELPIKESNPLRPLTSYAVSKATQDHLAEVFWCTRGLNVIRARIFNLVGPGQREDLVPATFIKQLRAMCDGDSIRVGNLATRRDFVDVRDVVRAFDKLLAGGRLGEAYNVASGASNSIRDVLNNLLCISGLCNIAIEEESARVRKNDVPDVFADITAITEAVGWRPQIPLRDSLQAMWDSD